MKKLKHFIKEHEELVMHIAGITSAMIGVGAVFYIYGNAIASLKIGIGLANLHEFDKLHLVDNDGRVIEELKEFHCIVDYAKKHSRKIPII